MKKKSQIRKYTVEKVVELTKTQPIPEMLKMYAEHVEDKKNKLKDKKQQLIGQLNSIRKQSQKIIYQMTDGVKDRLEKTQQIVMSANSRPSTETIKQLSDLFTYMQNQANLINNNSQQTNSLSDLISSIDSKTIHTEADYTQLDAQFLKLEAQCEKEQKERDRLLAERDSHRSFYNTIKQTIDQYRIKYDIVQGQISQREKQLDHLVSYFKLRQEQDQAKINHEINTANEMQQETLKAQQICNQHNNKNRNLEMKENEYQSRKLAKNDD